MIISTDDGDILIYQQTAIDSIATLITGLTGQDLFTSLDTSKTIPEGDKPWHSGLALFTLNNVGIKLLRGSGKYGQYTMEVV